MSLYQTAYRWRNDDGSETAATWLELVNTTTDVDVTSGNVQLRIRLAIEEQDGDEYEIGDVLCQFSINGGAYTTLGSATTGCIYFNSSNLTDGDDTTQQITAFTYQATNEGVIETVGGIGAFSNDGAEYEYTVEFVAADLSDGDSINFRLPDADGGWTNIGNATITKGGVTVIERTLTDNADAQDQQQAYEDKIRNLVSSLDSSDSIIRTITVVGAAVERILSSSLNVNDNTVNEILANRSLIDNVDLFDTVVMQALLNRDIVSFLTVIDGLSRDAILVRLLINNITASDTVLIESLLLRVLNDNAEITDSIISLVQGVIYTRVLSSELNILDAINLVSNVTKLLISTADINDALLKEALVKRTLSSSVDVQDEIISIVATIIERIVGSSVSADDSTLLIKDLTRSVLSSIVTVDSLLQDKTLSRLLIDDVDLLDSIIRTLVQAPQGYVRILADNVDLQDLLIRELTTLARGYILMTIVASSMDINTEESDVKADIKSSSVVIDTEETKELINLKESDSNIDTRN